VNPSLPRMFPVPRQSTAKFANFDLKVEWRLGIRERNSIPYRSNSLGVKAGKIFG
jgi:hypothetical protein